MLDGNLSNGDAAQCAALDNILLRTSWCDGNKVSRHDWDGGVRVA